MKIRRANANDVLEIAKLFHDTITNVNIKDYNEKQINIWASGHLNTDRWIKSISEQYFIVCEECNDITGFASITEKGYLDFMYVHKDHQGKGIATIMLGELEKFADENNVKEIWAHVSITARPFFKKRGYVIAKEFITKVEDAEFDDAIMTKARN